VLAFCVVAYLKREWAVRLTERMLRPVSHKLAKKISDMLDAFIGGLKMVPDRKKIALFVILTVLYWGSNGLGMMLVARRELRLPARRGGGVHRAGSAGGRRDDPRGAGDDRHVPLGDHRGHEPVLSPSRRGTGAIVAYAWVIWGAQFGQQVLFGLIFLLAGHISFGSLWQTNTSDEEDE